jgi:hypothetical protein
VIRGKARQRKGQGLSVLKGWGEVSHETYTDPERNTGDS